MNILICGLGSIGLRHLKILRKIGDFGIWAYSTGKSTIEQQRRNETPPDRVFDNLETALEAGPCVVTQIKTMVKDGYDALQVGFGKVRHINKPKEGHLKGTGTFRYLREVPTEELGDLQVGNQLSKALRAYLLHNLPATLIFWS